MRFPERLGNVSFSCLRPRILQISPASLTTYSLGKSCASRTIMTIIRRALAVAWAECSLPMHIRRSNPTRLTPRLQVSFSAENRRVTATHSKISVRRDVEQSSQRQNVRAISDALAFLGRSLRPNLLLRCPCGITRHKRDSQTTNLIPHLEMSELKKPTPADWTRWEPEIRAKYKHVTADFIRREMADNGLKVT
jgi:hypothetical protein